ncbi:MAG: putative toxin-antitoxin system toxin component, PIN family [Burkholderiales bacterium]|nr:putative toxin-antitoxin system toxin component, PIN family [Burkholderiales bacterium]
MRVVLDTNILVSGLAGPGSTPGRIVSAWRHAERFELVISEPLILELRRVVTYSKVQALFAKSGFTEKDVQEFIDLICLKAITVDVSGVALETVPKDPKDVPVMATLIASGAEWLVTGDKRDLLSLGMRNILTATQFMQRFDALRPPPLAEEPQAIYRVLQAWRRRQAAVPA